MNSGKLLPDDLACEIVAGRLSEPDCADGFILDGFPRSLPQAEGLDTLLEARGERIDFVVNLKVEDNELVQRLTERRTCPDCGKIYNLRSQPPAEPGKCDADGAALLQRDDDNEETARERLQVYHDATEPVVEFFDERGSLRSIEAGAAPPDDVAKTIEEIIGCGESV
jgi:adenylate kinase